jgi:hypothetical protein
METTVNEPTNKQPVRVGTLHDVHIGNNIGA